MTSTLETQPAPARRRPGGPRGAAWRSSGPVSPVSAWPSRCGGAARTTSSSWSGPTTSAAPGATTPIPARPATCSPTCTRSPSRRTPTGAAPTPSSRRSRPICRAWPTGSASASTACSAPTSASARWDDAARRWQVRTSAGEFRAQVLISAAGALADPTYPDIAGLDTFAGTVMHSARWDHAHDLTGERVAVIGTGASAIQVVPAIQPIVDSVTVYQRTPAWVVPRTDHPVKPLHAPAVPVRARAAEGDPRRACTCSASSSSSAWPSSARFLRPVGKLAKAHLHRQVRDPKLRKALTPDYTIGCKRILISNDYFPAVAAPNAELVTAGIAEVRPTLDRDHRRRRAAHRHDRAGHRLPRDRPADRREDLRPRRAQPRRRLVRRAWSPTAAPRWPASRTCSCWSAPTSGSGTRRWST